MERTVVVVALGSILGAFEFPQQISPSNFFIQKLSFEIFVTNFLVSFGLHLPQAAQPGTYLVCFYIKSTYRDQPSIAGPIQGHFTKPFKA